MTHPTNPAAVKVKRDGPRGWRWVATFDPETHELFVEELPADPFDHDGDGKPGGSLPASERPVRKPRKPAK